MKNFSEEILAYALQNALEFGKADASKILPKLFQHGLKKEEIKTVIPIIQETVKSNVILYGIESYYRLKNA